MYWYVLLTLMLETRSVRKGARGSVEQTTECLYAASHSSTRLAFEERYVLDNVIGYRSPAHSASYVRITALNVSPSNIALELLRILVYYNPHRRMSLSRMLRAYMHDPRSYRERARSIVC